MSNVAGVASTANAEQQQAIHTTEGPLLIIAGPGSGKTFTLVERIVHLITSKAVPPESLLVVTFTDKAAQELVTRISNRLMEVGVSINLNEMYLGTFHSVCLRWLEEFRDYTRLKRNFGLLDQFEQQYFFYQRIDDYRALPESDALLGPPTSPRWSTSETLLRWVNTVSEEALEPAVLTQAAEPAVRALGRCAALYDQQLADENGLDFSTIQREALTLLTDHPAVLSKLRSKISYLMVDEYQDTNNIQERILFLLAGSKGNLCVVGDDDQSLYRFRGATVRNILEFPLKFAPGVCQQVRLTTNYRSHPEIVGFYNRWMEDQNWTEGGVTFRYPKQIVPRTGGTFAIAPTVLRVSGQAQTIFHNEVLEFLHALKAAGTLTDWNQVAFLFSSVRNEKAVNLAQFLEQNGIAVYSPRSNQFFGREEIRLMLGAFIFLFPQFPQVRKWKDDAHLEIWDYYDSECFALFAAELRKPENSDLLKWVRSHAKDHLNLTQNADYAFSGLFYELIRFPLFSRYLDDSKMEGGITEQRAMRNLAILSRHLNRFEYLHHIDVFSPKFLEKNLRDFFNQFLRYLKDGGIDEHEDTAEYAPSGCVSFLTVHQAKGLEFPVVIVGSLHNVPRKRYGDLDLLLEPYLSRPAFEPVERIKFFDFRRLYYTAFSRPQNLLVLACQEIKGQGRTPSAYFADYFNSLPDWRDLTVDLSAVPLDAVKDVNLKREYSFTSDLTLFENCAEQYRFFRELEFNPVRTAAPLFGTLVHQTIEDIHKTVLRGEEGVVSESKIVGWFDLNYAYLTKRERAYLAPGGRRAALEHVLRYFHRHKGDWSKIREAEVEVSLVKARYILRGNVDLIRGENDTVEIVDFKSEKKPDVNNPKDREKLDRYRRQLEVYAHIIENRYGLKISKTHLYYTGVESGNPYITWDKDDRRLTKTIATFDAVVDRIENRDFAISERPTKLCENCDMRRYCDAKTWTFRKPLPVVTDA
jgi:DNA helicase II / ATP-dependent DNA helicase PcrA